MGFIRKAFKPWSKRPTLNYNAPKKQWVNYRSSAQPIDFNNYTYDVQKPGEDLTFGHLPDPIDPRKILMYNNTIAKITSQLDFSKDQKTQLLPYQKTSKIILKRT